MKLFLLIHLILLLKNVYSKENEICKETKCVQKCCPEGEAVDNKKKCKLHVVKSEIEKYPVYDQGNNLIGTLNNTFILNPGTNMTLRRMLNANLLYSDIHLIQNGTMIMHRKIGRDKTSSLDVFNTDEFCLDYLIDTKAVNSFIVPKKKSPKMSNIRLVYIYSISVSCAFLLLVLIVYALLRELRTLGGLVQMGYVGSLFFGFLFLAIIETKLSSFSEKTCIYMTLTICYFLFSSFCWMNVMSYDIWWTFRGYAKARPIHRRGVNFKFAMYCLFSYGVPLLLTIFTGVMTNRKIPGVIVPEILFRGCFLAGKAKLAYLYGPMLIMIIVNWIFFGMTAFNIWRLTSGTAAINGADSSVTGTTSAHRTNKQRLFVYMKLSVLMGLSWIFEVISHFSANSKFWYITDTYNMLIGVVVFIIFVCKKKIFRMLKKRFKKSKAEFRPSNSLSSKSRSTLESNTQSLRIQIVAT